MRRSCHLLLGLVWLFLASAHTAQAQPFGSWLALAGQPTHGYLQIPHHPSLNPANAFTFEAWVAISNSAVDEDCRSIAGKGRTGGWWLGQCTVNGQPTLRSQLKGAVSARNGGIIPRGVWTHIAVTFDGSKRRHYVNGELAAEFKETGPLPASTEAMRIGSDVSWQLAPSGSIDEVRLWTVARTIDQIRSNLNKRITARQPGLAGVWPLDGNGSDVTGARHGALGGSGAGFDHLATVSGCGASTATTFCLNDRFTVKAFWRTSATPGTPADGQAQIASCATPGCGLFWFFSPTNWEVMVKSINGCGLNNRWWVFSAATTNVFYRLEVTDVQSGETKIYFNYPGPPAPAVTDTSAFATCP